MHKMVIKIVLALTLMLSVSSCLSGCRTDEDREFDAFIEQVLDCLLGVEANRLATFITIETDSYGRILYWYSGETALTAKKKLYGNNEYLWAVFIQQKSDGLNVYYYPDISFIVKPLPKYGSWLVDNDEFLDRTYRKLQNEEIDEWKELNDWNKPFDESKCTKKRLTNEDYGKRRNKVFETFRRRVFDENFSNFFPKFEYFFLYATSDEFGRHIYFCRTVDDDNNYTNSYVVMFFPDNTYVIQEIFDIWNYQEELRIFKNNNNWNKSIQKE